VLTPCVSAQFGEEALSTPPLLSLRDDAMFDSVAREAPAGSAVPAAAAAGGSAAEGGAAGGAAAGGKEREDPPSSL
jgi:hypothetical protein